MPDYTTIAAPITDLTKEDLPDKVKWKSKHQQAFQEPKAALLSGPVLHGPDSSREFIIQTDALDISIRAVLSQADDSGQDRPITFYSRKLLLR